MKSEHSREQSMKAKPSSYENGEQLVSLDKELVQILTDDLVVKARIIELERLIDQSLDQKDEKWFMSLSSEYLSLTR